jgi:hypothetical protein
MLLKILGLEMTELDKKDYIEPARFEEELGEIKGTMTDDQKKLFTIATKMQKASDEAVLEAKYCHNDEQRRTEAMKKAMETHVKAEIIRDIMWADIKDTLGLWEYPGIAVTQGYKVIAIKRSPPSFLDFLRSVGD